MKSEVSVHRTPPREEAPGTSPVLKRLFGEGRSARLFTLIALVGGLHALLMLGLEVNRFLYTEGEIGRLQGEMTAMTQEVQELRAVLHHRHDATFREQLARMHGFVYPDELRVVTRAQGAPNSPPSALSDATLNAEGTP